MPIASFIATTAFFITTLLWWRSLRACYKKLDIRERILDSRATALQRWEDDLKIHSHKIATSDMLLRERVRQSRAPKAPPPGEAPNTGEPSYSC